MGDEVSGSLEGKCLSTLRVVDLKMELEKRGLSKSGSKKDLIKRLKQKLELEKLYEESSSIGESESKLHLDEATEQNEFVKQYLAEQQKIYARQKEVRRLIELRETEEFGGKSDSDSGLRDQDSDVSEGFNVSKNSCDSSTHAEGDDDEEERDHKSLSEESDSQGVSTRIIEPESSNQEEPCQSTSSPSPLTHGEAEPSEKPSDDMDSKPRNAKIAFSLSDISLPQSPKMPHGKSESKSAARKTDRLPLKPISYRTDSVEKDNVKRNGTPSISKVSSTETRKSSRRKSSDETDKIGSLVTEPEESLVVPSLEASKPRRMSGNQSSNQQKVDCSNDADKDASSSTDVVPETKGDTSPEISKTEEIVLPPEDTEVEVKSDTSVQDAEVKNAPIEPMTTESVVDVPQAMDVTESEESEGKLIVSDINSEKAEKPASICEGEIISDNESEMVDVSKPTDKQESKDDKTDLKLKKKRERSSSSSSRSTLKSASTSPDTRSYRKRKGSSVKSPPRDEPTHDKPACEKLSSRANLSDHSASDSTSDSDHRASKQIKSVKKDLPKRKVLHSRKEEKQSVEKVFDVVEEPPRQPKRPKINRSSFAMLETEETVKTLIPAKKRKEIVMSNESVVTPEEAILPEKLKEKEVAAEIEEPLPAPPPVEAPAPVVKHDSPPPKISYRKLNIPFKKNEDKEKSTEGKRRWRSTCPVSQEAGVNISTDSLKSLIPNFKLVSEPSVVEDNEKAAPKSDKSKEREIKDKIEDATTVTCSHLSMALHAFETKTKKPVKKTPINLKTPIDIKKSIDMKKPIAVNKEEPMEVDEEVSIPMLEPPKKPASNIVFVQNLVRPFTLMQLKDLLNQSGTITEDGFWIDKIKSKCFVKYENEEQASKTREALHGTRWPPSNPKILSVDFATQEEFETHSKAADLPKPPIPVTARLDLQKKEDPRSTDLHKRREREKSDHHDRVRPKQIREWDKDKLSQDSPEREVNRPPRESERNRSSERKKDKKDSKKKPVEDTPAKLLDDLFQKTKATPCIYWLPLTEDQVKMREEERKQRRLDREKRNQQEREQEAERRAKRKPREKENRSRSHSHTGRRR